MYEFVDKVVLPMSKKRILSSVVDLFLIEYFTKFELISLPALMIEHMYKVVHVKEGKHVKPHEYFLNKMFNNFKIIYEKGTPGTIKKMFTPNTLIDNDCAEGKFGTKSKFQS